MGKKYSDKKFIERLHKRRRADFLHSLSAEDRKAMAGKAPVRLDSKRGTRVDCMAKCDDCKRTERYLWHFANSNHGEVHPCEGCKERALFRSFPEIGNVDIMDMRPIIQTFESKRPQKRRI